MENMRRNNPECGQRISKSAPCSPLKSSNKPPCLPARADSFHVIHKVPLGDTPYVRAKHVQLVEKNPDRAIALFWAAINSNDRVDSALKDMAIVMKQQNRPEEAIEAIKSLRNRCSDQAQESLDNVLLDLYKRCGRLDDQITLLKHKLNLIHQGMAFNGKRTKTARSQGKKFQVSIEQETTRLLGNLGWAYMQQNNYVAAEAVYRKALSIQPDNNKMCNLGICLMKQGRIIEAKAMLQNVKPASSEGPWGLDSHLKSYERAQEMLKELEMQSKSGTFDFSKENPESGSAIAALQSSLWWQPQPCPAGHQLPNTSQENKRLVSDSLGTEHATTFLATAGFGPLQQKPQRPVVAPPHPKAPNSHFSMFSNSLLEENGWDGAGEDFADENINIARRLPSFGVNGSLGVNGSVLQRHGGALKQKLDQVAFNGISKAAFPPLTSNSTTKMDHILNSAALPFFISTNNNKQGTEGRMPLTLDITNDQNIVKPFAAANPVLGDNGRNAAKFRKPKNENCLPPRRSLSFGCVDNGGNFDPLRSTEEYNNKPLTKANSISLPLKDMAALPDSQEFEDAILAALCDSNPTTHVEKVRKRLRVFQELTASPKVGPKVGERFA